MPQTRKRKTKEKVSNEVEKKVRKTVTTKSSQRKGKFEEVLDSSEKKSLKSVKRTSSKKKIVKNSLDADAESSDESTKNKTSKQNSISPRKDLKLGRVNIKDESVDSGNFLPSRNSSDSGIMSEAIAGIDAITQEKTTDESIKSELSGSSSENVCIKEENESDSSESEWEEVEDIAEVNLDDYKPNIPEEGVEITIDCPELQIRKRKKKTFDENEWIRLYINRKRKDVQLSVHKTHLLCLLAHGIYVNKILNSDTLKALAMSYIPDDIFSLTNGKKIDKIDTSGIEKILVWFQGTFSVETETYANMLQNVFVSLVKNFECKKSSNTSEYNLMFIIIARALGFKARFCVSLYPVTHKALNLLQKPNGKKSSKRLKVGEETEKCGESEPGCSKTQKRKRKKVETPKSVKEKKVTSTNESGNKINSKKVIRHRQSAVKSYKLSDEDDDSDDEDFIMTSDKNTQKSQKSSSKQKGTSRKLRRSAEKSYKLSDEGDNSDDEDFIMTYDKSSDDDIQKSRKSSSKQKRTSQKTSNRSILSSDSEPPSPQTSTCKPGTILCWVEVFSKPDKQWIPIECVHNIVNKPYDVEGLLPQPVSYIIAVDNESYVKDVTRRYCSEYLTVTRKLRVDPEWWEETLVAFLPPNSKQNKEEEKKLDEMLINKPLPKTIQEFKNHPLYALKRHLLKFEGFYPPDVAPVGFMRGEPIYSRDCVCQLHSRETWVKEARVVKVGEEPYKIVKARPKWDRIAGVMRTDLPLELFGFWQTEQYKPPVAVNGKVPRNEYGNVELFKPCMLPKGTVHLQLPGLNRVAKKLGIDCSPAVVGFDGHKGSVHPVFEGFVVCKEFKDTVIAAWEEDQENARKREEEKREKRIYGNWKKLIKGLLIRERIKLKYHIK